MTGPTRSSLTYWLAIAGAAILLVATIWAYWPVLDNGWVWDDGANLLAARALWNDGAAGFAWAFTSAFNGHYQPLTWLSYRVDVLVSGASPRGVHATNLALHLLATALVGALAWWFAGRMQSDHPTDVDAGRRTAATLLCAALFALHPIHVETVAWATERRDLLSTAFVLAAVLLHLRTAPADSAPSRTRVPVAVLHLLAALARAQMSLPFVLLALDIWPLGRLRSGSGEARRGDRRAFLRLVAEKSLSFAVAAASATAALWAQASSGALTSASEHGFVDRLVQAGYGVAFYPAALAYRPYWLPLYERPLPFDPFALRYLGPALAALGALLLLLALRRRAPALATAAGTYLLFVLPVAGLAQSGIQLVAERYAYLATVPWILLAGCGVARFLAGGGRGIARALAAATVLGLIASLAMGAAGTRRQTRVWHDDETLWRHVLTHSESCLADNNLGQLLLARGEAGPALFHLVRALERVPLYPRPWRAIAAILEAPRRTDAPDAAWVAAVLDRAAAFAPGSIPATYASGLAWRDAGEPGRARGKLLAVLAREPEHEGARLALAVLAPPSPNGGEVSAPGPPDLP